MYFPLLANQVRALNRLMLHVAGLPSTVNFRISGSCLQLKGYVTLLAQLKLT